MKIIEENRISYLLFFGGTVLVAFGSSYYHLYPNNQTLLWDRLPMTIAFMALFSIVISEFVSVRNGEKLLIPFLLAGLLSVVYWHISELIGEGNLSYYAIVQFYPMIAVPLILICFKSSFTRSNAYWWLLLTYVIAKFMEQFDGEIYNSVVIISGHTIKHFAAAIGIYTLLYSYEHREIIIDNLHTK